MKDLKAIYNAYSHIKINKDVDFCHSMDKKGYRILCKNFFADKDSKKLSVLLAEETVVASNESEKIFLQWLNLE